MSDPAKTANPDPEIPEELRVRLSKPKRPADFKPKSEEAEEDNAKPEPVEQTPIRDTRDFFAKLADALKTGSFRDQVEEYEVAVVKKVGNKTVRTMATRERTVKVAVLNVGADGLPYVIAPLAAPAIQKIKETLYPGAPAMDRMLGDLTPEFVEWLYLTHPYDAAVRYFSRSTHVQTAALERSLS